MYSLKGLRSTTLGGKDIKIEKQSLWQRFNFLSDDKNTLQIYTLYIFPVVKIRTVFRAIVNKIDLLK